MFVAIPGDKSISHRALIVAALARGRSRVRGLLESADVHSTAAVLRALGVAVPPLGPDVTIDGVGPRGLRDAEVPLDCGNSGTTARLVAGVVAGAGRRAILVGDASLLRRPMRRVAAPLAAMGARVTTSDAGTFPLRIEAGVTHGVDWASDTASAQVKSCVLLAALCGGVPASVREPVRSRDHTERLLAACGAPLTVDGTRVALDAFTGALAPVELDVPGDPSSAAFFAALALLTGRVVATSSVTVNRTRAGFLDVLTRMGARVDHADVRDVGGEPCAALTVQGRLAAPAVVGADEVPSLVDELPLVACLGALAPGETRVTGAQELRVKESDRIAAVVANLRAVGAEAEELPDGFVVRGHPGRRLAGAVTTHGDHRIAMAFGVLGAVPGNAITVDDPACAVVSFPGFWEALARVAA
jgi:3-phosphoshikimate 1-carboxyvinyltransferase